nr:putative ribonuclease H-like domain-containing protein [Tanacetum cinerariifolium]
MMDYGYNFMQTNIHVDNESAICVIKNPVYHSKTKHIEIRHHFIRDSYEKRLIKMVKIHIDNNVADLLIKAFDANSKEVGTLRYLSLVVPLKKVGDEAVHKELGDVMERATTTASSLETKKVYSSDLTMLILRVKKLGRTVKTRKARRKARIVISEDKNEEGPSNQGRSLIEELDMDVGISLCSKVLADAAEQGRSDANVQTYTRQRRKVNTASRLVSTADVSIVSEMVSTAGVKERDKGKAVMQASKPSKKIKKRIQVEMSIDEELAQKLHEKEQARFNAEQKEIDISRQEKVIAEADQAYDIDWSDPAMIRYHAL